MRNLIHYPTIRFIALILLTPLLLFWRWIFNGEVIFWGTLLFQFWPWHQLAQTILLRGEWPLWNSFAGNGTPLLANLQTALFYPPNLLYVVMPVAHALTLSVMLHLSLAGILMYGYSRQLKLSPFAATVAGLTYMFSGYIVGRTQFVTMINALAWFPLLLLLSERIVCRTSKGDVLWLGLILAIQLLAGHAQLWFYGMWLIAAYMIFRIWQSSRLNQQPLLPNLIRGGVWLGVAMGLALLLAAVQILPTAEFITQSPRNSGAERTFALTYSFWPWRLISLVAPNFFGNPAQGNYWGYANYWEDHAYLGVLPFLLALTAIWQRYRGRKHHSSAKDSANQSVVPFFAALIPISLVLALGWNTPIYLWVFDTIPGFSYFQAPSRLLIWYTLAMSILAGIGVQTIFIPASNRPPWRRLMIACLGIALAGLAGNLVLSGVRFTFLVATATLGFMLVAAIIILLLRPDPNPPPLGTEGGNTFRETIWQGVVLIFILGDLLWVAATLIPFISPELFEQPIASAQFLKAQAGDYRFFVDDDFDYALKFNQYFRFEQFGPSNSHHWQTFRETLAPNVGLNTGLRALNNDDPLVVGRWQQLVDRLQPADVEQRERLLGLMNVRYLINTPPDTTRPILYDDGIIAIQQLPISLPRAYFVPRAYRASDETAVLDRLTAADFDSQHEVIIMDSENRLLSQNGAQAIATEAIDPVEDYSVKVTAQSANQITLIVDAPSDGFVVLTDTYYPGWQATIDGQPSQIWPANLAFRMVEVTTGQHEIIFRYRPRSFLIGLWVSSITLIVVIIGFLVPRNK